MALGIACAGTGLREAIALLEPMVKFDPVNFVRQGALIASAQILIQQTDQTCPKTSFFRSLYSEVITNKHEDVMAKYGAILAQGIIDAGGRNVTVSLQSRTGHTNLQAVVGMLVFTQYWYWFPLAHCLSLAFTPTCLIGLNSDLKMPKVEIRSAARPSLYAYPAPLEEKKTEEREKVATAVLSIAARQKRRETADKKDDDKMEVDEDVKEVIKEAEEKIADVVSPTSATTSATPTPLKADKDKELKEKKDKKEDKKVAAAAAAGKGKDEDASKEEEKEPVKPERKEPEATFEILQNPARTLRQQLKVISLADGQNYKPMKDVTIGGIVVLHHLTGDEETLVEPVAAYGPKSDDAKEEPDAPEPFEYFED